MNLSYQHVNPASGGGSYLVRFGESGRERTPCILVDSGTGVDLDARLGGDEYLACVLLTHAHLDHYASLSDSLRDGAPVYTSEATASVLEDVLTEGEKNYAIDCSEEVLDAVHPLDGWETVVPGVETSPVPAGHTPGAAGFVVRFGDGSRARHLLFTGDFTTRPVAGYPGLPTELPVEVDVLFVNVSTTDGFEETLSDSLFRIAERARAGSSVLVTASALTGVHYAYLLGHLGDRLGERIPVALAGQGAKLYADLGYDVPNVDPVPVFDDTDDLLERGTVTIAGPEVPAEGSARRLFETIEGDSGATLVQLTGGATDPIETASCTVYDFEVVNHPSLSVIDELVDSLNPIHVVAGHGSRRALRTYRGRYDERFVWASDDDREQVLYEGGQWSPPPWLSDNAVQSIRAQDWRTNGGRFGELVDDDERHLPSMFRSDDPDLEAEGVDVERFEERFGGSESGTDAATPTEGSAASDDAVPASDAPTSARASTAADESTAVDAIEADSLEATPDRSEVVEDTEAFRTAVLDRLETLETRPTDPKLRARVVEGGDDVTLLRLLDDANLEHGEEVAVVLADRE